MRYLIVAGGRDFMDAVLAFEEVDRCVEELENLGHDVTIVSGGAKGADFFGEVYAETFGIPLKVFPADWDKHGKAAGPIRNAEMAKIGTDLIAFWDGKSRGTKHMIDTAKKKDIPVKVIYYQ